MVEESKPVVMATKLPAGLRDQFVALAKARNLTPSTLLRRLVELELAGAPDGDAPGAVESAVVAEITERRGDVAGARAATAVNLSRRMDRDPTSGAQNAAQLRLLLAELSPPELSPPDELNPLTILRICTRLKQGGVLVPPPERMRELLADVCSPGWRR